MVESFDPVYVEHTTEIAKVHGKNVFHSSFLQTLFKRNHAIWSLFMKSQIENF